MLWSAEPPHPPPPPCTNMTLQMHLYPGDALSALLRALSQVLKLRSKLPLMETWPCVLLLFSHVGKPQAVLCTVSLHPHQPALYHYNIISVLLCPACAGSVSVRGEFLRVGRHRDREKLWGISSVLLPHSSYPQGKMEAFLCLIPTWGIWGVKKKPQYFSGNIKGMLPLVGEQEGGTNSPLHLKSCQSPRLSPGPFYFEKKSYFLT